MYIIQEGLEMQWKRQSAAIRMDLYFRVVLTNIFQTSSTEILIHTYNLDTFIRCFANNLFETSTLLGIMFRIMSLNGHSGFGIHYQLYIWCILLKKIKRSIHKYSVDRLMRLIWDVYNIIFIESFSCAIHYVSMCQVDPRRYARSR